VADTPAGPVIPVSFDRKRLLRICRTIHLLHATPSTCFGALSTAKADFRFRV
jgi:hypothetical protein